MQSRNSARQARAHTEGRKANADFSLQSAERHRVCGCFSFVKTKAQRAASRTIKSPASRVHRQRVLILLYLCGTRVLLQLLLLVVYRCSNTSAVTCHLSGTITSCSVWSCVASSRMHSATARISNFTMIVLIIFTLTTPGVQEEHSKRDLSCDHNMHPS
jgi:hypothetical protein